MPSDAEIYAQSRALVKAGKPDEAYKLALDLVMKKTELWEPYYEAAIFSFYSNDYKSALGFFKMAALREKKSAVATVDLTNLLLAQGHYSEALDIWKAKLSKPVSREALAAFLEFVSGESESADRADEFFRERVGGPKMLYPDFCHLMRQSALPDKVEVIPQEPIPSTQVQYYNMQAPGIPGSSFPGIWVYELRNAIVRPYSDLVIMGENGIIPDYFNLEEHLLYDTFIRRSIPFAGGDLILVSKEATRKKLPAGIILTSYTINNWAHFLTELMPIVAMAEALEIPTRVPLLISKPIASQMIDFLNLIKSPERAIEIISCPTQVVEAIWFTPVSTVPFEYLKSRCGKPVHYAPSDLQFSPSALAHLKAGIQAKRPLQAGEARVKVFLDRDSARRRVINQKEVVQYFADAGFVIAKPEHMSLQAQIDLFSRAEVIVGQTGAGLANMLFAPEKARIIVLSGNPEDPGPHSYFPNLARALGHEMHYVAFGPCSADLHIDFEVDLEELDRSQELF
jgi:hypothetical protein